MSLEACHIFMTTVCNTSIHVSRIRDNDPVSVKTHKIYK